MIELSERTTVSWTGEFEQPQIPWKNDCVVHNQKMLFEQSFTNIPT